MPALRMEHVRPAGSWPLGRMRALGRSLSPRSRLAVTLAAAAATAAGAALLILGGGDERRPGVPFEASAADLRSLASGLERPLYWAGTRPGTRLEVTETGNGRLYVRYLPRGVPLADKRPDFLTVGTYPYGDAYAATSKALRRPGMVGMPTFEDGLVAWNEKRPSSVYLAYRGSDVLVEIFSPKAADAQRLALSGEIIPVR
jgi:hypothetical protein